MREIKFRVFDTVMNFMDDDVYVSGEGNVYQQASTSYNTPNFEIERCPYPVMQYTGLKDKNGVEIYEGDILKYNVQRIVSGFFVEENHIGQVVYECGCYIIGDILLIDIMDDDDEIEVIGNIYENKNLLEDN